MGFLITRTAKCAESRGGRLCDAGLDAQIERKLRQKGRPRKPSQFSLKGLWGRVRHSRLNFFGPVGQPIPDASRCGCRSSWRELRTIHHAAALSRHASQVLQYRPPVAVQASAHLPRCSRVAHSQPLPARTTTTTASCPTARGQPVHADPFGPQIIPRSRDTRLGSLVDTMSAKKTRSTIGAKCKPAEQKGSENVLRSQANFRPVQWMWRLGSQSLICPTVHNAQDTRDSGPVCTVSAD